MTASPGSVVQAERGIRTLRLTKGKFAVMLGISALSVAITRYLPLFLEIHENICSRILTWLGLRVITENLIILRGIPSTIIPVTDGPDPALSRLTILLLVSGVLVLLGVVQFKFPMVRSFVLFTAALITVAT